MRRRALFLLIAAVAIVGLLAACETGVQVPSKHKASLPDNEKKAEPSPIADSYLSTGPDGTGGIIIPSGRRISPASNIIKDNGLTVGAMPVGCAISPDGMYAFAMSMRDDTVFSVNLSTWAVESSVNAKVMDGMVMNAAGTKLWVSGGGKQKVNEYDISGGEMILHREMKVGGYPIGLALSPDEQTLYIASSYGHRLAFVNLSTGTEFRSGICQVYPYGVVVNSTNTRAYVSNWGSESVSVINTSNGANIENIQVGKNPEGLVFSADGSKLYVANSDSDTISVINTSTNTVVSEIELLDSEKSIGAMPTGLLLDGTTLYAACAGYNSLAVVDTTTDMLKGHIPTGWYPTAACNNPVADEIFVTNAKGIGWLPEKAVYQPGSVTKFDSNYSPAELAEYTDEVIANNERPVTFYEGQTFESPVPLESGTPSEQIKHVIFVMKENKTYDSIFGDLPVGNGDPDLAVFGEHYTPNAHSLASSFTNSDNFYSESELSLQGHMWGTATICNDYVEKSWANGDREPLSGVEPAAIPENGSIFMHLYNHGIPFRSYGQVVGTVVELEKLAPYVSLKYGFYNMGIADTVKMAEVIRDMEAGIFPPFVYISLPNDHTDGTKEGSPTMQWYVGDNDAALGMLVDYVSHSEHWKDTAIFVTQDDPQSVADHVDAHRTIGLVISPWAKHGYLSSVMYSMNSMWVTMERILGVPPLTNYDKFSAPMYDCFSMTPDYTPYDALPNNIPFEYNTKGMPLQAYCEQEDWDAPDQIERMGEVVWAVMRPGEVFPAQYSVDPIFKENPEEEAEEAKEYKELVRIWTDYAHKKGIELLKPHLRKAVKK